MNMNCEIRVLQLEDNLDDAEMIQRQLRRSGLAFIAERVETREAFVRALEAFRPDVVLADYKLPTFDGRAALDAVGSSLPVIIVSGTLRDQDAVELIKAGADDFILKDRLARLGAAVQRALAEAQEIRARQAAEAAVRHGSVLAERKRREHEEVVRRSLEESMHAMARAFEMRDPYTAGHQSRVAHLACAIASELGLDADRIRGLALAAGLHDLGKIAIPAEILNKRGRLTELELDLIRTHAQAGYDILKDVHFVWPIADIIRQHHERLDGSGYPRALKGSQILHEAKILAVADVVEAMAGPRPYRAALGLDAALAEIARGRGVTFDARAADACVSLFRDRGYRFAAARAGGSPVAPSPRAAVPAWPAIAA